MPFIAKKKKKTKNLVNFTINKLKMRSSEKGMGFALIHSFAKYWFNIQWEPGIAGIPRWKRDKNPFSYEALHSSKKRQITATKNNKYIVYVMQEKSMQGKGDLACWTSTFRRWGSQSKGCLGVKQLAEEIASAGVF